MLQLAELNGFDWDAGNDNKSLLKHGISQLEAEQVFFNQPLLVVSDPQHSRGEQRLHLYGKNDDGELRHITFTMRGTKARVISARPMHRKERKFYEENT